MNPKKIHCAKGLKFRLDSQGILRAQASPSAGEFCLGLEMVQLLALIQKTGHTKHLDSALKGSLKEVIKTLPEHEEIQSLVEELLATKVLVDENDPQNTLRNALEDGFADPWIQWAMIADEPRMKAYQKALESLPLKESTVLDVGAGSGFLTAFSLYQGAKEVHAIEETAISSQIKEILTKMNLSTKKSFKLYPCNSYDAEFPADIQFVVSELFGNDPFSEGVIPTLRDIQSRVTEKTKFVPQKVEVFLELSALQNTSAQSRLESFLQISHLPKPQNFTESLLFAVRKELDFSSLSFPLFLNPDQITSRGECVSLGNLNLEDTPFPISSFNKKSSLKRKPVEKGCPVFLMWFRVTLVPGVTLSSHPLEKDACFHWSPIIIPFLQHPSYEESFEIHSFLEENECQMKIDISQKGKKIACR